MLLVIDVGNTNTVMAVYDNDVFVGPFRVTTLPNSSSDEMGILMSQILNHNGINDKNLEHVIVASVVPEIMYSLRNGIIKYFGIEPMVVGPGMKTGINVKIENPKELGADRLANAVAAYAKYGGPILICDYGTASKFDVVSQDGTFVTGITAPGIKTAAKSLTENTSMLFDVEIKKMDTIMAKNTAQSIQAGIYYGNVGLSKYIISKLKEEMNEPDMKIVATGGLAKVMDDDMFDHIDPLLTIEGLKILFNKNIK